MKIKITHKTHAEELSSQIEETVLESLVNIPQEDLHSTLEWLNPTELFSTHNKRVFIYDMKLKNSDIPVYLSKDGVFFYFGTDGDEITFDQATYDWLNLPPGTYHEQMLENLEYRLISVDLVND